MHLLAVLTFNFYILVAVQSNSLTRYAKYKEIEAAMKYWLKNAKKRMEGNHKVDNKYFIVLNQ